MKDPRTGAGEVRTRIVIKGFGPAPTPEDLASHIEEWLNREAHRIVTNPEGIPLVETTLDLTSGVTGPLYAALVRATLAEGDGEVA